MQSSKTLLLLLVCCLVSFATLRAQDESDEDRAKPRDLIEFGIQPGYLWLGSDVDAKAGYGVGVHFRKALDYIFSLRLDGLYGQATGDNESKSINNREFETSWLSTTAWGVMSLNNFRFTRRVHKVNYYAMAGGGANYYETTFSNEVMRNGTIEREIAYHAGAGAGIAFRLGKRVNLGLEYQGLFLVSNRADLIDGSNTDGGNRSVFRDVVNFANVSLNFNLGNTSNRSEPLYWVSPLSGISSELDRVNKRMDEALVDSDDDGIIDAIDREPNTPADVPVDTKGRTLDSDKDGVPDYKDKEPFFPPRAGERVNEDGVVINPTGRGGGVSEERVQEMIDASISAAQLNNGGNRGTGEMFFPMIHFPLDRATVKYSDYGTLAGVARILKADPATRIVVRGYTDQTGSESYNEKLSYERAKAVVDHLVNQHGVSRSQLLIQWKGKDDALVPLTQSYMNRRVEFSTAGPEDSEMYPPNGTTGGTDGY